MDNRHWPYDPHAPPREEPAGWVVAGEEDDGWASPPPPSGRTGAGWPGSGPTAEQPRVPQPGYGERRQYGEGWYDDNGRPPAHRYPPAQPPYPPHQAPPPSYQPPAHMYPSAQPPYPPAPAYPPPGGYREPREPYPSGRAARPAAARSGPRRRPPRSMPDPPAEPAGERRPSWLPVFSWTVAFFVIPVLLYLGWAMTRSGVAPAWCVDAAGAPCPPPRDEAITKLTTVGPALGGALALAVLVSVALRRMTDAWRASTVGFAAAVIGAGAATLVASVLR